MTSLSELQSLLQKQIHCLDILPKSSIQWINHRRNELNNRFNQYYYINPNKFPFEALLLDIDDITMRNEIYTELYINKSLTPSSLQKLFDNCHLLVDVTDTDICKDIDILKTYIEIPPPISLITDLINRIKKHMTTLNIRRKEFNHAKFVKDNFRAISTNVSVHERHYAQPEQLTRMAVREHGKPYAQPEQLTRMAVREHGRPYISINNEANNTIGANNRTTLQYDPTPYFDPEFHPDDNRDEELTNKLQYDIKKSRIITPFSTYWIKDKKVVYQRTHNTYRIDIDKIPFEALALTCDDKTKSRAMFDFLMSRFLSKDLSNNIFGVLYREPHLVVDVTDDEVKEILTDLSFILKKNLTENKDSLIEIIMRLKNKMIQLANKRSQFDFEEFNNQNFAKKNFIEIWLTSDTTEKNRYNRPVTKMAVREHGRPFA